MTEKKNGTILTPESETNQSEYLFFYIHSSNYFCQILLELKFYNLN